MSQEQLYLNTLVLDRLAKMEKLAVLLMGPDNNEVIVALCEELWPDGDYPWERTEEE